MKTFRLQANCLFKAEDAHDAVLKLAEHFRTLADSDPTDLILKGEIVIGEVGS